MSIEFNCWTPYREAIQIQQPGRRWRFVTQLWQQSRAARRVQDWHQARAA